MGIERDWTIDAVKGKKLDPSRFRVSSALQGYAWDVGMRAGDHLMAIDDISLNGLKLAEVTDMLRGLLYPPFPATPSLTTFASMLAPAH